MLFSVKTQHESAIGIHMSCPSISASKESACNVGDLGSTPWLGRSPGEGKGYPLQYSDLENSWDCMVHGVTKSQTRLSKFHFHKKRLGHSHTQRRPCEDRERRAKDELKKRPQSKLTLLTAWLRLRIVGKLISVGESTQSTALCMAALAN